MQQPKSMSSISMYRIPYKRVRGLVLAVTLTICAALNGLAQSSPGIQGQSIVMNDECDDSIITIHPNDDDFLSTEKIGRILIESPDQVYHTPYQTEDGSVRIKATFSSDFINEPVFFLIIDPEETAEYSPSKEIGDNFCDYVVYDNGQELIGEPQENGLLFSVNAVDGGTIDPGRAAAEIQLQFSNETCAGSGDNFSISAFTTLNSTEEEGRSAPISLTAWKRLEIVSYNMYQDGFYLAEDAEAATLNGQAGWNLRAGDIAFSEEVADYLAASGGNVVFGLTGTEPVTGFMNQSALNAVFVSGPTSNYKQYDGIRKETTPVTDHFSLSQKSCLDSPVKGAFMEFAPVSFQSSIPFRDFILQQEEPLSSLAYGMWDMLTYWMSQPPSFYSRPALMAMDVTVFENAEPAPNAERPNGFTLPIALAPDDVIDYPYISVFSEVPHSTSFSDVDRREATLMHELVHVFDVQSGHIDSQGSIVPSVDPSAPCCLGHHDASRFSNGTQVWFDGLSQSRESEAGRGCLYSIRWNDK